MQAFDGQVDERIIAALADKAADDPRALAAVAAVAAREDLGELAYAVAARARAMAPRDPQVRSLTQSAVAGSIPHWHFRIIRDEVRNAAYDEALRRAVISSTRVLDIGAGTGLLSMMAARAGAPTVVACEKNPAIADAAAEVVAANGLSGHVKIIPKISTDLDPGGPNGIVQWIHLTLDETTAYENRPGCGFRSCWACLFHPLMQPASAGQTVKTVGIHDRRTLRIWAE